MKVFIGQIDAFDPQRAGAENTDYAGELSLCAVSCENIIDATQLLLRSIEDEGVKIKTIDFCGLGADYPGDPSIFNVTIDELEQAAKASGKVVFSDVAAYEKD